VADIRKAETGMNETTRAANTVAFPEMRKGKVAVSLATVLARASGTVNSQLDSRTIQIAFVGDSRLDYRNQEMAYAVAQGQLAYYRVLESEGHVRMIGDWPVLEAHLRSWKEDGATPAPLGFILSMEGADPIVSPSQVARWWDDGLRVVGLSHYGVSAYAHGTGTSGGLTDRGVDLLKAMEEVGMVLDVTHLADESFWQAVEQFHGPVLASHNNCRALVPGCRQFTDEQIRHLIERDSVIGTCCEDTMLFPGWVVGKTSNSVVSLEAYVDQIDHVCQLAGNNRHSAIGSDLDGGFGVERCPREVDTIADLQKIPELLRKRGYQEVDIEMIMHGNWVRFFKAAWNRH
jgi:membrane dipeptidase